jgi:GTPase SAR1 family protein
MILVGSSGAGKTNIINFLIGEKFQSTALSTTSSSYIEKQITWTIAAISEFAKAKALSVKQAFNYLSLFKGMDFLEAHYGAEHLLSFDDTVEDLTAICQRNGGQIQ